MQQEIIALIKKPEFLAVFFLLFAFLAGMAIEQYRSQMRNRSWRERNSGRWVRTYTNGGDANEPRLKKTDAAVVRKFDAADQLRIVMGATFTVQPLLNKSESRVFKELDRFVISRNPGWQVMAQVTLGEILRSPDADAYSCINSKRVDLLLIDEGSQPRHAIEYQGAAHYQAAAAARDAVKKEALRRAGIGYHEVVAGHTTPSELKRLVEKRVDKPATLNS